jgi:hypothetical protein
MKKWNLVPCIILLLLGGVTVAWSQSQMPSGYWFKSNTTMDKLHEDYKQCAGKNEDQCMQGKGYRWVTEGINPGYWFKPDTTIDKLHEDYRNCRGQEEAMCMERKGYPSSILLPMDEKSPFPSVLSNFFTADSR